MQTPGSRAKFVQVYFRKKYGFPALNSMILTLNQIESLTFQKDVFKLQCYRLTKIVQNIDVINQLNSYKPHICHCDNQYGH